MNNIIITSSTSPYNNLALEEHLVRNHKNGTTLYLWQNHHTIVIGKSQNAWHECKVESLLASGGYLARRKTGGGAVYHDLGGLNFSFIGDTNYTKQKGFNVILRALKTLNINAELSGRNDITVDNAKVSGNAFRQSHDEYLHHGTLLINTNMNALNEYLIINVLKLEAKGIKSVRSQVANLKEFNGEISTELIRAAILKSFITEFGNSQIVHVPYYEYVDLIGKYSSYEFRLEVRIQTFHGALKNYCLMAYFRLTSIQRIIK